MDIWIDSRKRDGEPSVPRLNGGYLSEMCEKLDNPICGAPLEKYIMNRQQLAQTESLTRRMSSMLFDVTPVVSRSHKKGFRM